MNKFSKVQQKQKENLIYAEMVKITTIFEDNGMNMTIERG